MGRWSYSNKTEADDIRKIGTSFLKKHDYYQGWRSGTITWTRGNGFGESKSSVSIEVSTIAGDEYLRIYYTQTDRDTGEKKDFDYNIPLTTTPCYFGGKRYWFICPMLKNGKYCGRRVGVIYKDGDLFACRHCYGLTYASRNLNRHYKYFPLFNMLILEEKMENLEKQIKRRFYAGGPTKKQKRLDWLYGRSLTSYRRYARLEKENVV